MVLSNGAVELVFESDLNRTSMRSLRSIKTGAQIALSTDMLFYEGGQHPTQQPWVVRPSGPYIFHPKHAADQVYISEKV